MESPAFSDERQQDVAEIRKALDAVGGFGVSVKLPVMAAAELCALGALSHPVIDARALAWWTSQPDREAVACRAYDHMAARKLLDPETARLSPHLGLILAGRSRPAFILLTRDEPAAEPRSVRVYGIADESGGTRAVLLEALLAGEIEWAGPGYQYMLAGVTSEASVLAEWAAQGKHHTIDFYLPGSGVSEPAERLIVTPARHRHLLVDRLTVGVQSAESVTCDQETLASLISSIMMGAGR